MAMGTRAVALWCALAVLAAARARVSAYTVDCNHEYTDCDTELGKIESEDEAIASTKSVFTPEVATSSTSTPATPTLPTQVPNTTEAEVATEARAPTEPKPKPRLLNLSVDELQNFANALHNQTNEKNSKKPFTDLSDVTMDDDDDEPPRIGSENKHKGIPDKFYSNLQAPFHPLLGADRGSEETETCKENEITYKVGDHIDRGCEESCECAPNGVFECSPRCKHPYIRRGRRLNDPLCFESPVDDCCSIIACATGNGDTKTVKLEVCRYGNDTFQVGAKWNIGCEQSCSCEPNSVVTCKPRCKPLLHSDKCINVQDPNDACCEVQVCDVSQDVHEEPADNATTSTSTVISETARSFEDFDELRSTTRPLVLAEPIGSVKVLHNNSVRVNLMHMNNTEDPIHLLLSNDGGISYQDIELKYSNLILNLDAGKDYILKTRETGTKFNFTITTTNDGADNVPTEEVENATRVGCYQDDQFYAVGEEFHIGCSELCECTGPDTRECAALVCPSHVGLELVSKGCVRWAPSPPPQPPNCCPRSARCLSDGTCHYDGVAVPNWSEVPISLTGCDQRCFCENGELDCQQEVCSPLPPVPPQSLRCPPQHRPAHVNISDEDCCKQWGCVPNTENSGSIATTYRMPTLGEPHMNFATPVAILPTITSSVLPTPPVTTDSVDFYKHLSPVKSYPKYLKTSNPVPVPKSIPKFHKTPQSHPKGGNITVFTLDDLDSPFKTIHAEPPLVGNEANWKVQSQEPNRPMLLDSFKHSHPNIDQAIQSHPENQANFIISDSKMHDIIQSSRIQSKKQQIQSNFIGSYKGPVQNHESVRKIPISQIDNLDLFLPSHDHKKTANVPFSTFHMEPNPKTITEYRETSQPLFESFTVNRTANYLAPRLPSNSISNPNPRYHPAQGSHMTVLRTKDLKIAKPTDDVINRDVSWHQGTTRHLLTKEPSPYETVLLRAVPNARTELFSKINQNVKAPQLASKTYSTLDLENLLTQMEVESEVNRNLGRSADKNQDSAAGKTTPPGFPAQQPPSFLPTIPPEIHFPQEDIPDYDQNNIHRPINSLEPSLPGIPPGLTVPPIYGDDNKKLSVISLQADSPTSVKMLFGLPPVLVGLRGSVDLRYTDKADEDITHWYSQVFAPADEILTTPRLEFRLAGLKPSTTYKIRGKLYLHNLPVEPESEIYSVRTPDLPTVGPTAEEKRKEIDSRLTIVEVNDTSAHISWRHFTEDELQFIDGIQVRYRPMGTPIYSMTELLHHSRSAAELHDLRPGSRYEASLVLVPPPRATTELHDPGRVEFTTAPFIDPYNWSITVEARAVGSEAVELTWRGVPSPAERWVRVYRAAHACGPPTTAAPAAPDAPIAISMRNEHDAFRLAARDLPPAVTLTGLQPNTRCRVWLELFLTNGKVKTSNVLEINTKSIDSPEPVDNEIESISVAGSRGSPRGDYYGALVVVGVVAALGALTSLLLLLVVVRRHRPHSVPITTVPTAPRESSLPPYDNPAYKLELQQETMDL